MKSFRALFNRPFMPWHMHQIGTELKKEGGLRAVETNATILARKLAPSATAAAAAAAPLAATAAAAPLAATAAAAPLSRPTGVAAGL